MSKQHDSSEIPPGSELYEIRFKGHLDARWAEQFDGLCFIPEADGTTILSGPIADQAALHGLIRKLRDLGLPLVSVFQVYPTRSMK